MSTIVITAALNGAVPPALLAPVPGQRPGILLALDAAASMGRLSDECERLYGWRPYLNTAYRTRAQQDALVRQGLTTLAGGKSEHGLARAADLDDLGGFSGVRYRQLAAIAHEHGWYQPQWARTWRPEPWHWEYDPDDDQHRTGTPVTVTPIIPKEWDEMASKEEVQDAIREVVRQEVRAYRTVVLADVTGYGTVIVDVGARTFQRLGPGRVKIAAGHGLPHLKNQGRAYLDGFREINQNGE